MDPNGRIIGRTEYLSKEDVFIFINDINQNIYGKK